MSISFIKDDDGITVTLGDGFQGTVYASNPKFAALVSAIRASDEDRIRELCDPKVGVEAEIQRVASHGLSVKILDGVVYYEGEVIHSSLADRIVELVEDGLPVQPLLWFLQNLMQNSSYRAVEELYGFLEVGSMPITEDGCFLAYKRVRGDFMDSYTGTFDNSVGAVVTMPRNKCDEDSSNTCSHGLHFCSRGYLGEYGGGGGQRDIMVKINPRDVVAIPEDYGTTKGRCCRYEVVASIDYVNTHIEGPLQTNEDILEHDVSGNAAEALSSGAIAMLDEAGTFLEVFESARLAQEATSVDASSIRKVCRGDRRRAGGYNWEWAINVPGAVDKMHAAQGPSFADTTPVHSPSPHHGSMGFGRDVEDAGAINDEDEEGRWNDDIPF